MGKNYFFRLLICLFLFYSRESNIINKEIPKSGNYGEAGVPLLNFLLISCLEYELNSVYEMSYSYSLRFNLY